MNGVSVMDALKFMLMSNDEKKKMLRDSGNNVLQETNDLILKVELDMPGSHQKALMAINEYVMNMGSCCGGVKHGEELVILLNAMKRCVELRMSQSEKKLDKM